MNAIKAVRSFLLTIAAVSAFSPLSLAATDKSAADQEQAQRQRLEQAQKLIAAHRPADAMPLIDQTLAYYAGKYPEGKTRWYVARTPEETLRYMLEAALVGSKDPSKANASSLYVAWEEDYFLKAYAHLELGQTDAAIAPLDRAMALSPSNAKYLIERAEIEKLRRNWNRAYQLYKDAEEATAFSPSDEKAGDLSHAKRGQAFVFIEQGKLDDAKEVLLECLKLDRNDAHAKQELEYIEQLRREKQGQAKQ
jgi:tetratricopeptide (TPR) repeat protein